MKEHIRSLLEHALAAIRDDGDLTLDPLPDIAIERSRGDGHGDFASPLALALARVAKRKPREIAERIVARLPESASIASVEIAGPGFINFSVATAAFTETVRRILASGVQQHACCVRRMAAVSRWSSSPRIPPDRSTWGTAVERGERR